jgi:hypothetical protein
VTSFSQDPPGPKEPQSQQEGKGRATKVTPKPSASTALAEPQKGITFPSKNSFKEVKKVCMTIAAAKMFSLQSHFYRKLHKVMTWDQGSSR